MSLDFFAAQHSKSTPEIDLHHAGYISDALEELDTRLSRLVVHHAYCRIIYGVGTGALRRAVHERLRGISFVKRFEEEESGGSCIVFFS